MGKSFGPSGGARAVGDRVGTARRVGAGGSLERALSEMKASLADEGAAARRRGGGRAVAAGVGGPGSPIGAWRDWLSGSAGRRDAAGGLASLVAHALANPVPSAGEAAVLDALRVAGGCVTVRAAVDAAGSRVVARFAVLSLIGAGAVRASPGYLTDRTLIASA